MKTVKTTKEEDENENNKEEERVSQIRFELCWWIQEEHCGGSSRNAERVHESYELKWDGERDAD